ncbi:interleukin-10 receptor subunit beta [Cololabis saira]|uniref:interleukin-10 receptor subunit beta n=1 Tax=Cololabis saira TaxID=129043 RepID=UPI002AD25271|nr:interleukin-10 receptor subunit beta [Cololabis saira]
MMTIVCLLLWLFHCGAAEAEVPPPGDLTMSTLNTNYALNWDWNWEPESNVTFRTEFVAKYKLKQKNPRWTTACEEIRERSCDLTFFNLYYRGLYCIRVRANVNGSHSGWAFKDFCPDKEAGIGPPSRVVLGVAGSHLDVVITDPLTSTNTSMKENLPDIQYQVLYWERDGEEQDVEMQTLNTTATMVTLPNMRSWTWYCVRVQSVHEFYSKRSSFTAPHCMQTEGPIPWWQICLIFLGSLLICFLLVALSLVCWFWFFQTCRELFFPKLPTFFKTYLLDSPGSNNPHLVLSDSETELLYDHVIICPNQVAVETADPPAEASPRTAPAGLEPDSSSLHGYQGSSSSGSSSSGNSSGNSSGSSSGNSSGNSSGSSSSSGDSGVFSTGDASSIHQTFPDLGDSSGGSSQLQHMKMEVVEDDPKHPPGAADKGFVDVCV